ncbi:MAG: TrkA C-terminal domain-containing protein [Methanomicrobiales archaeon]|nr:TrkA C-terminal domain-containing protein [Methanomicrobiales archaeon]MDI6876517.1 TrkA C-terminal domain-containing protein [Methanomicrobiales archaeon]
MVERDYQPRSFKDVLIEMKDISELMVDLSYSAILFENKEIAREVVHLEESMNEMVYQARITSILGARRLEEAEWMSGMLQVAEAAERISNSASQIAQIVLRDIRFPAKIKQALPEAEEVTIRVIVNPGSALDRHTLGELRLQSRTGMRVIAIRRGYGWFFDPDKNSEICGGDILIAKGLEGGVALLHEMAGGAMDAWRERESTGDVDDLDRAVRLIVEMKNLSELAVGLAYTSLLFNSKEVANEVATLADRMHGMRYQLDLWVLESARRIADVEYLRGLLYMTSFAEAIGDAAHAIADVILRDIEIPPLFRKIVRESDEIISRVEIRADSLLAGRTLQEASLGTVTGMVVLAIKRGDRWTYRPGKRTRLEGGDVIIAKGRRDGECRLLQLSGEREVVPVECGEQ